MCIYREREREKERQRERERESRSEGFALTGYVAPGCVEDMAWMLWEICPPPSSPLPAPFLHNCSKK